MTATRAQALQTAQPALEALYQALRPEQREVLDRPMGMDRREHGGNWRGRRERERD